MLQELMDWSVLAFRLSKGRAAIHMSTSALIIAIIVAVVVVVAVAVITSSRKGDRLKSRFGPEYERTVQETGSRSGAEARLGRLEKRVEGFNIRP
jgi:hypothetical protein